MRHVAWLKDAGRQVGGFACVTDLGPTIVAALADAGTRCRTTPFNPALLRGKGTAIPDWLAQAFPGRVHRAGTARPACHRRFMRVLLT